MFMHLGVNLIQAEYAVTVGIISVVLATGFAVFIIYLAGFHSYLLTKNVTTWECLSGKKISYLADWPRELGSPWNFGIKDNIRTHLCYNQTKEDFFIWKMPRKRPSKGE